MSNLISSVLGGINGIQERVANACVAMDCALAQAAQKAIHSIPSVARNRIISWAPAAIHSLSLFLLSQSKTTMQMAVTATAVIFSTAMIGKKLLKTLEPSIVEKLRNDFSKSSAFRTNLFKSLHSKPPMLVLIAEEDWNGALDVDLKGHCLASFASKYDITIEKLNESWDIAYYIEKFAQKKGKKFPVFVMAHGSEHAMHFGKGIEGQYHDQLVSAGEFKGAKELILWSCSTGAKGGIGEKIALTHPGLVVFAPKKPPSYLEDYSKRTNEMDVEFYDLYEGIGRRICFFKEPRELIELLSTSPKNSLSLLFIGQMYKFGIGIKKNRKLGKNLIKQSQAIVKYSDLEKGQLDVYHNLQSDGKKTELILKEMYKTRGDLAYYQLGRMHFEQGGYEDGFICFQKAANNGDRKAQKALSWMYSRGIGVGRDHKKARYWLQQSKNKTHS